MIDSAAVHCMIDISSAKEIAIETPCVMVGMREELDIVLGETRSTHHQLLANGVLC